MSDVQIAVIDQQDTQIVLAVPGVQGATGSSIPSGGTADQVLRKNSSTDYDANWTQVTSAMIANGTIVNEDINNSAAIAGTKISPDFGGQAVTTTGQINGARVNVTGNTVPSNGLYLPSANNVALSTNGTGRLFVDASGRVGIGTASPAAPFDCSIGDRGLQVSAVTASHVQLTGTQGSTSSNLRPMRLAAQTLSFNTGASTGASYTERVFIDTNGNVGIGTPNAAANIHVLNSSGTEVRVACSIVSGDSHLNLWEGNGVSGNADTTRLGVGKNNTALIYTNSTGTARAAFAIGTTGPEPLVLSTNNTERLRITSAGLVGIGTSAPSYQLEVDSGATDATALFNSTSANGSHIRFARSGAVDGYLGCSEGFLSALAVGDIALRSQAALGLATGGANTRLYISSTGAVGIGTTSPDALLTVNGIGAFGAGAVTTPSISATGDLNTGFWFPAADTIAASTNGSERARIDSSGRLLVGTSSARTNLRAGVYGSVGQIETAGTNAFAFIQNAASEQPYRIVLAKQRSGSAGGNTIVNSGDNVGSVEFLANDGTNFIQAAKIETFVDGTPGADDMPGRLVFSTTADGASSPTERMRVTNKGYVATYCDNVAGSYGLYVASAVAASSSSYLIVGTNGASGTLTGTASFIVATNGNVTNTNNSYGAISDIKLKENIVDAGSQWDDLKALQVRKYNFKEGQTHTQIGLIAQEVELVSPGLVSESPDRDAEGNDLGTVTKSVNYSVLYMKAVKALQEAMERIEVLEQRLNDAGIN